MNKLLITLISVISYATAFCAIPTSDEIKRKLVNIKNAASYCNVLGSLGRGWNIAPKNLKKLVCDNCGTDFIKYKHPLARAAVCPAVVKPVQSSKGIETISSSKVTSTADPNALPKAITAGPAINKQVLDDVKAEIIKQFDDGLFIIQRIDFDVNLSDIHANKWYKDLEEYSRIKNLIKKSEYAIKYNPQTLWSYIILSNQRKIEQLSLKPTSQQELLKQFYNSVIILAHLASELGSSIVLPEQEVGFIPTLADIQHLLGATGNFLSDLRNLLKNAKPSADSKLDKLKKEMRLQKLL